MLNMSGIVVNCKKKQAQKEILEIFEIQTLKFIKPLQNFVGIYKSEKISNSRIDHR